MRRYWTYILASRSRVLYIGMTGDLMGRMTKHRLRLIPGFASKYSVDRLVHAEWFPTAGEAIRREKQLKGWVRRRKVALIEEANPEWRDLTCDWGFAVSQD